MSGKREQKQQKVREQSAALVEPGETLRDAVPVTRGPLLALGLGPLGVAFLKFRIVALTDEALYVMSTTANGWPKEVELRTPLPVAASIADSPFPGQNKFLVGDQNFNLGSPYKEEAERIATAAAAP